MTPTYCASIVGGIVAQIIVCHSAEWAAVHLGGEWQYAAEQLVCIGWTHSIEHGFRPPQPYASWQWGGVRWTAPTPRPDEGSWYWDEASLQWQAAPELGDI